jgi:hypothetical protein
VDAENNLGGMENLGDTSEGNAPTAGVSAENGDAGAKSRHVQSMRLVARQCQAPWTPEECVGQDGSAGSGGGNGGVGVTSSLTNTIGAATGIGQYSSGNYYFAGGGGGTPFDFNNSRGYGGLGGGGKGSIGDSTGVPAMQGMTGTGGGGGGGDASAPANGGTAGNGGSGSVIVRYLKA